VYREGHDDDVAEEASDLLPALAQGQTIEGQSFLATERFSRPPARYTEASLVKKLEELGIGRPSTYAPTISTILRREYVRKGEMDGVERAYQILRAEGQQITSETATEKTGSDKGKLLPTDTGTVVTDFLLANFHSIMDYAFTANMEESFDEIAEGTSNWQEVIAQFHTGFSAKLKESESAERASGERILGAHPATGLAVSARVARFGPIVQIAPAGEEEKPRYASIPATLSLETITLEQALKLFELPRTVGEFEGQVLKANTGRFGPYVQHGKEFISLPKEISPLDVTQEQAIELIEAKRLKLAADLLQSLPTSFGAAEVRNGRYGPYIKLGKENFKIPKGTDPMSLDAPGIEGLITEQRAQPSKGRTPARGKRK
jgi:DNA topoisomerase-1